MEPITLYPNRHVVNIEAICTIVDSIRRRFLLDTYLNVCFTLKEDLLTFASIRDVNGHVKFGKKLNPNDIVGPVEDIIVY